jgi:hypothetical protein
VPSARSRFAPSTHHRYPFAHLRRFIRELVPQPVEHCRIGVERVHLDAGARDRERDAAGAGAELKNRSSADHRLVAVPLGIAAKRRRRHEVVEFRSVAVVHVAVSRFAVFFDNTG